MVTSMTTTYNFISLPYNTSAFPYSLPRPLSPTSATTPIQRPVHTNTDTNKKRPPPTTTTNPFPPLRTTPIIKTKPKTKTFSSPSHKSTTTTTITIQPHSPPRRPRTHHFHSSLASLRLLLLGSKAIVRESRIHNGHRRLAERLAVTRGIVIFADYLADLIVLDLFQDVATIPLQLSLPSLLAGLSIGVVIADFLTGIAAWLVTCHVPPNFFSCFPHSITTTTTSNPTTTTTTTTSATTNPDVFHQLVNSCFFVTPALSVVVSWAHNNTPSIFIQTTVVSVLALSALTPLLRPRQQKQQMEQRQHNYVRDNDAFLVQYLRNVRFLKQKPDGGWAQICGVTDPFLHRLLPVVDLHVAKWKLRRRRQLIRLKRNGKQHR